MLLVSSESRSVLSDSATPRAIQPMEFSRPEYWSGQPFPSPGDLPNPGIEPWSFALQEDSLPAEPPGKPKNTVVGSLSLLQQIFPTQESNWGFLHCKWILYQLSYQGSPDTNKKLVMITHALDKNLCKIVSTLGHLLSFIIYKKYECYLSE